MILRPTPTAATFALSPALAVVIIAALGNALQQEWDDRVPAGRDEVRAFVRRLYDALPAEEQAAVKKLVRSTDN